MSEIITNDNSNEYFDDNSLVEDDYYYRIKDIIKCKSCDNIILNDPMMCGKCYLTFCKNMKFLCNLQIFNDNYCSVCKNFNSNPMPSTLYSQRTALFLLNIL